MSRRTKFYRDKQNGKLAGVCSGIADYTGIDVAWVRIAAVCITLFVFQPLIIAYIVAAMVTEKKPSALYVDHEEQKFWQGVRQSPARTARDVRSRFREIDRRLADVEMYYTSNNRQLSEEIERLR
ncbi:MAG: envelope stress response membrane protein PspC [Pseudomonadota bacterium]